MLFVGYVYKELFDVNAIMDNVVTSDQNQYFGLRYTIAIIKKNDL